MKTPSNAPSTGSNEHPNALPGDHIDRLLDQHLAGTSEQLAPSSGFVLSVMESIQAQAAEPPPIAFPWRRVLPGVSAIVCGLIAWAVLILRGGTAATTSSQSLSHAIAAQTGDLSLAHLTSGDTVAFWIVAALCLSLAVTAASLRLTGSNE
jgi:hypothetical protein